MGDAAAWARPRSALGKTRSSRDSASSTIRGSARGQDLSKSSLGGTTGAVTRRVPCSISPVGDSAGRAEAGPPRAAHPGARRGAGTAPGWVAAGLVATLVLGVGAWALVSTVGSLLLCGPDDTAYARRLTESAWLRLQPSSARPLTEPEAACEADDRMATATRSISVPDMTARRGAGLLRQDAGRSRVAAGRGLGRWLLVTRPGGAVHQPHRRTVGAFPRLRGLALLEPREPRRMVLAVGALPRTPSARASLPAVLRGRRPS